MAKFVAISGPAFTGKSSLVDSLSFHSELSEAVFSPDMYNTVWNDLIKNNHFSEWTEINKDVEYLCLYIVRLIDYYSNYIEKYKESDKLVILDGCWIDLSIYAMINLWYTRPLKELQEEIFSRVNGFKDHLSRIYFTQFNEDVFPKVKDRRNYRMADLTLNIPLERQYYNLFSNFKNAVTLPSSDISESSLFILDDLRNLGYIQ